MDKVNFLIIVSSVTLFISVLLAIFLLTVKTKNKVCNILFAVFIIVTAIDVGAPLFNVFSNAPSNIGMFRNSFAFLQIPTFYLYILSVSYSDFKIKPKHIFHITPFLLSNIILLPRFYLVDGLSKVKFLENHHNMIESQINHILIHIQIIAYVGIVFLTLSRVKKLYLENYSGKNLVVYNWLFQFTLVIATLYSVTLFKNIFKFTSSPNISDVIKTSVIVLQLFIICWYLFKALNNPDLFRNIDSKLKLASDFELDEQNSEKIINEKNYDKEIVMLRNYMKKETPFLDPSLTIQSIAEKVKIPVRDLSILINTKLENHFFDFVNSYRINSAKEILKDSSKSKVTVLEILYEVGFNSKSSFNTAFKKHTGMTPTAYRKQYINSDL